ncbi:MAG: Ig-like domain-containing protein, partial [Candidatus Sumerlaeota bacterium]|nr:Ig-like domain-containing protein [Candidatus Sumerlaeota bacterium]
VAGATTDVYTVTADTGAGEGTIRLDLNAGTDIRTASGQAIANTPFLLGEAYLIDRTPPVLMTDSLITSEPSPVITGAVSDTSSSIVAVEVELNGVVYSATFAGGVWSALIVGPLGQGIYDITSFAYDAAGNVGYDYSGLLLVDQTPPTVTVDALLTSQPQPTLTGTFNDTGGTGIGAINVTVGGETAPAVLGASTWSVVVPHALSDGVYDVQVAATDLVGNVGHDLTTNELRVDLTSPVVISVAPPAGVELTVLTTITVVFSEPVTGVTAANLTIQDVSTALTTPSLSVSTADGIAYQFIVPQPADGPVTLTLTGAGAIRDQAGMPFDSYVWTYTMNSNALFVTLSSPSDVFTSGPFLVIATFSHDVADFDATDILTTNASISAFTSSSAQVYQWLATPNLSRLVQMQITTGVAHSALGQPNRSSNVLDRIFDGRAPFIVILSPPRNSIVTTTDLAVIAVTFSESVSGVAPEDLIVNGSAATAVFGSGPGPYLFSGFAAPATVDVTVQALGGTTLDQVGNAFEGDSWSYIIDVGSSAVREWMRY